MRKMREAACNPEDHSRKRMLFHLEAASAQAEELGETFIQDVIDMTREFTLMRNNGDRPK